MGQWAHRIAILVLADTRSEALKLAREGAKRLCERENDAGHPLFGMIHLPKTLVKPYDPPAFARMTRENPEWASQYNGLRVLSLEDRAGLKVLRDFRNEQCYYFKKHMKWLRKQLRKGSTAAIYKRGMDASAWLAIHYLGITNARHKRLFTYEACVVETDQELGWFMERYPASRRESGDDCVGEKRWLVEAVGTEEGTPRDYRW